MKKTRQQVIEIFGKEKVAEVEALVFVAGQDPDVVYTTLQDQGDDDGATIIEMLYYEND